MEYYKNAQKYAERSLDSSTIGLVSFNMGDILTEEGIYEHTLVKYGAASKTYQNYPEKQALCYSSIGRTYLFRKNTDSAFYFFNKGLGIAEKLMDINLQRQLAENLSVAYEQVMDLKHPLNLILNSLSCWYSIKNAHKSK